MKIPSHFGLKWKDAINAIMIMFIGNGLMVIMSAADGELPSWNDFRIAAINTFKFGVAPYLLKNFFSNDVKAAQKTLSTAKVIGEQAKEAIPPVTDTERVNIAKFPDTSKIPGKDE